MYHNLENLWDKTKRHYAFSEEETKGIFLAILAMAFIAGFDDGTASFDATYWFLNFLNCMLIVTLAVLVHYSVQRIYALDMGYKLTHKPWTYGIAGGVMLSIASLGQVMLFMPAGFTAELLERHRLGTFRYGLSLGPMAVLALLGAAANVGIAVILQMLGFLGSSLIEKAVLINLVYALSTMLPIPPLDGSYVFFYSRGLWFFAFGSIAGLIFLLKFFPPFYAFLLAISVGVISSLFYVKVINEKI